MSNQGGFCDQVPPIYESFLKVIFDHAVGEQILGPTTNPCPTFFTSPATGDVWSKANWGTYPQGTGVVKLPQKRVKRLIAIGDCHGDIKKTREALEIAQLLGPGDKWSGGKSVLVQVGDIFDRGGREVKICYLLEKLRRGAYRDGGAVHVLHGNHETENMLGRYRYVLKDAFKEFNLWKSWYDIHNSMKGIVKGCSPTIDYKKCLPRLQMVSELAGVNFDSQVGKGILGRLTAMRPGGPLATQFLARSPTVLVIGKTMFVHGGIKFSQVLGGYKTLNSHNSKVNEWVKGNTGLSPPSIINPGDGSSVTWNRDLGSEDKATIHCGDLYTALHNMVLERLVIGHTMQGRRLINSACEQQVIRIDVGMSKGCLNNPPQALEILDDEHCNVLSARGSMPLSEADALTPRKRYGPDDDGSTETRKERIEKQKKEREGETEEERRERQRKKDEQRKGETDEERQERQKKKDERNKREAEEERKRAEKKKSGTEEERSEGHKKKDDKKKEETKEERSDRHKKQKKDQD